MLETIGVSRLRTSALRMRGLGPFDIDVEAGSCVALEGPSGAGKTLLLRAIADLDEHRGRVFLGDTESAELAAPAWRRQVAMLPAESAWWYDSVGEHFEVDADALLGVGLPAESARWQISRLSTGEKQRLAVLRVLANRPRALLLDEPTANLDPDSIARVERLLTEYRRNCGASVLWVTHDSAQAARVADRRLQLVDGGIVEGAAT